MFVGVLAHAWLLAYFSGYISLLAVRSYVSKLAWYVYIHTYVLFTYNYYTQPHI